MLGPCTRVFLGCTRRRRWWCLRTTFATSRRGRSACLALGGSPALCRSSLRRNLLDLRHFNLPTQHNKNEARERRCCYNVLSLPKTQTGRCRPWCPAAVALCGARDILYDPHAPTIWRSSESDFGLKISRAARKSQRKPFVAGLLVLEMVTSYFCPPHSSTIYHISRVCAGVGRLHPHSASKP